MIDNLLQIIGSLLLIFFSLILTIYFILTTFFTININGIIIFRNKSMVIQINNGLKINNEKSSYKDLNGNSPKTEDKLEINPDKRLF